MHLYARGEERGREGEQQFEGPHLSDRSAEQEGQTHTEQEERRSENKKERPTGARERERERDSVSQDARERGCEKTA